MKPSLAYLRGLKPPILSVFVRATLVIRLGGENYVTPHSPQSWVNSCVERVVLETTLLEHAKCEPYTFAPSVLPAGTGAAGDPVCVCASRLLCASVLVAYSCVQPIEL
jgi:hypothetical protein